MSDTPKLMVSEEGFRRGDLRPADERDRDLVVVWLREQGAGEDGWKCVVHNVPVRWETATNCTAGAYSPNTCDIRPVLVIPLDTEPPKETE